MNNHLLQNCVYAKATQYIPVMRVSGLPPDKKQALWAGIKQNQPALAKLLAEDRNIKALKDKFKAEYVLTQEEIDQLTVF